MRHCLFIRSRASSRHCARVVQLLSSNTLANTRADFARKLQPARRFMLVSVHIPRLHTHFCIYALASAGVTVCGSFARYAQRGLCE